MTEPGRAIPTGRGRVLGIDACKAGWVGIALTDGRADAYFATEIGDLVAHAETHGALAVVAVDMPIGLPDTGRRLADVLAREAVGPRWPSVFMAPVRPALEADDHASAVAVSRRLAGEGVSRQAFALKAKLLQVDRWVRRTRHRVVEIHPEVSFARLAGAPLLSRKSTWAGAQRRRDLLTGTGIVLTGDLGPAGAMAAVDDVLDAAVAAWTARRVAGGQARPMPEPPQTFSDGLECAIWA
jgi:predicted RNase H-like nuclease